MELSHSLRWLLAFDRTFVVVLYEMGTLPFAALASCAVCSCRHRTAEQQISTSGPLKFVERTIPSRSSMVISVVSAARVPVTPRAPKLASDDTRMAMQRVHILLLPYFAHMQQEIPDCIQTVVTNRPRPRLYAAHVPSHFGTTGSSFCLPVKPTSSQHPFRPEH